MPAYWIRDYRKHDPDFNHAYSEGLELSKGVTTIPLSKYKGRETCMAAYNSLVKGKSLTALPGILKTTQSTLEEWRRIHPELEESIQAGKEACKEYWLNVADDAATGLLPGANTRILELLLKNNTGIADTPDSTESAPHATVSFVGVEEQTDVKVTIG